MSWEGGVVFILCAVVAVLGAVATIGFKSPLRCAVALLVHILALAGLYLTLHAHLIAAIQLIVYAGAVVVLFVFVIMLIGPSATGQPVWRGVMVRTAAAAIMGLVGAAIVFQIGDLDTERPAVPVCAPGDAACEQFGGVEALGRALYRDAAVPFEIVSILLLVAIIGAIAVARGRTAEEAAATKDKRLDAEAAKAAQTEREKKLAAEVAAHGGH
jgi:NADH-quinone oxidoreductase subunit J